MKITKLYLNNFKIFKELDLELNEKSTVLFGINGTGKSTVLEAVNYLFRVWINRINPSQGKSYESFTPEMIRNGSSQLTLSASVCLKGENFTLERCYQKVKPGKKQPLTYDKGQYALFTETYVKNFLEEGREENIPIFVNYGTNRSVLDIPLRIRKKHEFDQASAMEYAVENTLDFRAFFEWFRNREDLENELIKERGELSYQDGQLFCVRRAIEAMLGNVSDLRVKRSPLCMVVTKGGRDVRVDMLSDGEKCTLALLGDLARRLAIANPIRKNPLEGEGVVLIDEIELHMHPSWQRRVLSLLKEIFPNIQFVITTHSPQILGETDDSYNVYLLSEDEEGCRASKIKRMDGFDSNMILEEYMSTSSRSAVKKQVITKIYQLISSKEYDSAAEQLRQLKELSGELDEEYILAAGFLTRSRILDENHNS